MTQIISYKQIEDVEGFRPQNGMNFKTKFKNYSEFKKYKKKIISQNLENKKMKKLFSIFLALAFLIGGNAYAENITIKCVDKKRDAQQYGKSAWRH